jgi:hypothetical protein
MHHAARKQPASQPTLSSGLRKSFFMNRIPEECRSSEFCG